VAAFVGILQSKGSAVVGVDQPQVFRQAVRMEARRQGIRVRTGIASHDPKTVWAVVPEWRRAVNQLAALLKGAGPRAAEEARPMRRAISRA
jgi:hypothetical protein